MNLGKVDRVVLTQLTEYAFGTTKSSKDDQMPSKSSYLFGSAHLLEDRDGGPEGCGADAGLRADGAKDGGQRREGERHDAAGAGRHLQDAAADARQAAPPLEPIQLWNGFGNIYLVSMI